MTESRPTTDTYDADPWARVPAMDTNDAIREIARLGGADRAARRKLHESIEQQFRDLELEMQKDRTESAKNHTELLMAVRDSEDNTKEILGALKGDSLGNSGLVSRMATVESKLRQVQTSDVIQTTTQRNWEMFVKMLPWIAGILGGGGVIYTAVQHSGAQ